MCGGIGRLFDNIPNFSLNPFIEEDNANNQSDKQTNHNKFYKSFFHIVVLEITYYGNETDPATLQNFRLGVRLRQILFVFDFGEISAKLEKRSRTISIV